MLYEEAMEFISYTNKLGSILGLETIANLLNRLGNPQDKLKIIHVAGTNGKGSTISFLSSILAGAGYRVGVYISPTVFSYREKLQIISLDENVCINNLKIDNRPYGCETLDDNILQYQYISEEDICKAIKIIKSSCENMVGDGLAHPTSFEIETAMAFLYMQWEQVDFLILETGMGGRLDATNVIDNSLCSVITSVSLDHTQFLGDTLELIANEKAGIMKLNSSVITTNQHPEVLKVFCDKANELDIPMTIVDKDKVTDIRYSESQTTFVYPYQDNLDSYEIHLLGKYQVQNGILAIETARRIRDLGYPVSEEAIKKGLYHAKWQGRFEKISKAPEIYIDGAHNIEAAQSLRDSIEIYFTNRRLIFMIGVLADKDYQSMLRILAPMANAIITLTPDNQRALASNILAKEAGAYCKKIFDEQDIYNALERVHSEAKSGDVIIAFGSLSFLGNLVRRIKDNNINLHSDSED